MNDITCPCDGDFCQKKQDRIDEWRKRCLQNPQPYSVFIPRDRLFADCPIKHEEERKEICERYRRYCYIVNKTVDSVEQSLKKMIRDKTISVDYEQIMQNLKQR